MGDLFSDGQSADQMLERLSLKGKGLLDLSLDLGKNLCVKGFVDAQMERGGEYLRVVEAMQNHIDAELLARPHGRRRELLVDLQRYVAHQLAAAHAIDEPGLN